MTGAPLKLVWLGGWTCRRDVSRAQLTGTLPALMFDRHPLMNALWVGLPARPPACPPACMHMCAGLHVMGHLACCSFMSAMCQQAVSRCQQASALTALVPPWAAAEWDPVDWDAACGVG